MSGVLKTAATVLAVAVGTVLGGPIGAIAAAALTGGIDAMVGGDLFGSHPASSNGGSQTKWKADPYAGIPYVMGRTLVSGNIVARLSKGSSNEYEGFVTVLSLGPINAFETTFMNKTTMTWSGAGQLGGGEATGAYAGYVWEDRQLGLCPEATKVGTYAGDGFALWTSDHKLSGLAACFNVFVYNSKDKNTLTTEPQPSWIIEGVKVYDPRLDSTYPGGSGACRALDESTYVYSEDPHLHGLTWCLGRWQNGRRRAGIGAPLAAIDIAAFVEGANLNDARGWKLGGQVYTRPDSRWNSLGAMLQAGGAKPVLVGGRISCINQAPRVSLAMITHADIVGEASIAGTQPRRTRINGVIPSYRSEEHNWEMVPAGLVQVADYVTMDGDERTKEIAYSLVQDKDQAAKLAAYDICNAREMGPITLPAKPIWLNYKMGDCITVSPEPGWSAKAIIIGRAVDPQTGTVTLTLQGETDGKHSFCLGQTGIAPAIVSYSFSDAIPAPGADWSLAGTTLTATDGTTTPAIVLTGDVNNASAEAVVIEYRLYDALAGDEDSWISASIDGPNITRKEITQVTSGTDYEVSVRYRVRGRLGSRSIYGPVTAGALAINGGTVLDGTINTQQIAMGAVTDSVRVLPASSFNGTGGWQTVATLNVVLDTDAQVDIQANAEQGFSSGSRDWGFRAKVDGVTVKEFAFGGSRTALTEILTLLRTGLDLMAGTRVITLEHAGTDSSVVIRNIDLTATRRSA